MDTVPARAPAAQGGGARARALAALAAELATGPGAADALALGIVDATLAGDREALGEALAGLRAAPAGDGADALAAAAQWALERLPGGGAGTSVAAGTHAHRFLGALAGGPLGGAEVREALGTDETQVSRLGRRLLDAGLVTRGKAGRSVRWELSPRGREALASAPGDVPRRSGGDDPAAPGGDLDWWRYLQRRAWRAGDDPDAHGRDPEERRILGAALELHVERGVLATSWPEIAAAAGVEPESVARRWPTVEDLVPACGGLAFAQLRLPPPEEAEALLAGRTPAERLEGLAELLFDVYARAEGAIVALERDADRLPVLGRAHAVFEEARDSLIAAALERPEPAAVGLARELLGLPAWRALRAAGRGPDAAAAMLVAALGSPRAGFSPGRDRPR
jgi:AcrR family transcriptional regulator